MSFIADYFWLVLVSIILIVIIIFILVLSSAIFDIKDIRMQRRWSARRKKKSQEDKGKPGSKRTAKDSDLAQRPDSRSGQESRPIAKEAISRLR